MKISRVSGGRRSTVQGLKLVDAMGSKYGKVGVSTNSKR